MYTRLYRSHRGSLAQENRASSGNPRHRNRLILCLIPLLTLHLTACRTLQPQSVGHEIDIHFVNGGSGETLIEPASGWPLTLSLTANEEKIAGIWTHSAGEYPKIGTTGALVFEDPDGCPSWEESYWQRSVTADEPPDSYPDCLAPPAVPWPEDETAVEFTLWLDRPQPGCSGRPQIKSFDANDRTNEALVGIGPCAGPCIGATARSCGYGHNSNLPGLVVLADAGPSVFTSEDFNRPLPRKARNLAGLFQSVAYELKDLRGKTSIRAHMNVPEQLFSPVLMVDESVDDRCNGTLARIDGGPVECLSDVGISDVGTEMVTIRAFVVNGQVPPAVAGNRWLDELEDANGDGVVDIKDAEQAGWRLLSGQAILKITQLGMVLPQIYFDLDGDGEAGSLVLPPDPGSIEDPPR